MYDSEFIYLRERIDQIADILSKNTAILEANTDSLKEHIRRTELLEQQMDTALLPIYFMKWLAYGIGIVGTIAGTVLGIWQLVGK